MKYPDDDIWEEYLPLKTGFGNVIDVGYGWEHEGLIMIASAIMSRSESEWTKVTAYAKRKRKKENRPV